MAYRIDYSAGEGERVPVKPRKKRFRWVIVGGCVLLLASALMFPKGRRWVRDAVLPGDEEVTAQALQNLVSDLQDGEEISDAVSVFCHQIISGRGQ